MDDRGNSGWYTMTEGKSKNKKKKEEERENPVHQKVLPGQLNLSYFGNFDHRPVATKKLGMKLLENQSSEVTSK
ncbi:hypothetical protein G9A89_003381 [Geosiphon pyriformis]|nr:hypothetical protein G9A89_003381 [Geosiphon pyriformis]